jgi:hypothetical protein
MALGRQIARIATPAERHLELLLQEPLNEGAHLAADRIFQRIEPVGAEIAQ